MLQSISSCVLSIWRSDAGDKWEREERQSGTGRETFLALGRRCRRKELTSRVERKEKSEAGSDEESPLFICFFFLFFSILSRRPRLRASPRRRGQWRNRFFSCEGLASASEHVQQGAQEGRKAGREIRRLSPSRKFPFPLFFRPEKWRSPLRSSTSLCTATSRSLVSMPLKWRMCERGTTRGRTRCLFSLSLAVEKTATPLAASGSTAFKVMGGLLGAA